MLASFEMMARIALMRHALVVDNRRWIPPEVVEQWLEYVRGQRDAAPGDCQEAYESGGKADGL